MASTLYHVIIVFKATRKLITCQKNKNEKSKYQNIQLDKLLLTPSYGGLHFISEIRTIHSLFESSSPGRRRRPRSCDDEWRETLSLAFFTRC